MRKLNLIGERFGNLVVLNEDSTYKGGKSKWNCVCDCGKEKAILACHLRSGKILSCGCYRKKINAETHKTHGMAQKAGVRSKVYSTWASMISRCKNPVGDFYAQYGGRGIQVCERWRTFENFYADMGDKPEGHSIERIDVNGNYEPSNCRWANNYDQSLNKTNTIWVNVNGEVLPMMKVCEMVDIPYRVALNRKKMGWPEWRWFEPQQVRQRSPVGQFMAAEPVHFGE